MIQGLKRDVVDGVPENTYKLVRLYSNTFNLLYSVYCNNQHELYDMDVSILSRLIIKGRATLTIHQG